MQMKFPEQRLALLTASTGAFTSPDPTTGWCVLLRNGARGDGYRGCVKGFTQLHAPGYRSALPLELPRVVSPPSPVH